MLFARVKQNIRIGKKEVHYGILDEYENAIQTIGDTNC